MLTGCGENLEGDVLTQPRSGVDGFETDPAVRIARSTQQQGLMIRDLGGVVTKHAHGGGPDTMVLCDQQLVQ